MSTDKRGSMNSCLPNSTFSGVIGLSLGMGGYSHSASSACTVAVARSMTVAVPTGTSPFFLLLFIAILHRYTRYTKPQTSRIEEYVALGVPGLAPKAPPS